MGAELVASTWNWSATFGPSFNPGCLPMNLGEGSEHPPLEFNDGVAAAQVDLGEGIPARWQIWLMRKR
jgi:hypothetical protein